MAKVVELRLGLARAVDLLGVIEFRQQCARLYGRTVRNEFGKSDSPALAHDLGHLNGAESDRSNRTRRTNLARRRTRNGDISSGRMSSRWFPTAPRQHDNEGH